MLVLLDVARMKSDDCCRTIQEAISARDPDAVVVVMRIAGRVSVNSTLGADDLVAIVSDAGYPAMLAYAE